MQNIFTVVFYGFSCSSFKTFVCFILPTDLLKLLMNNMTNPLVSDMLKPDHKHPWSKFYSLTSCVICDDVIL